MKKEIDVGILQVLSDNQIAFLPYVNNTKIRDELRPDIRALQVPEWNQENYSNLLPIVVSEVWRSYLERTVSLAIKDEKLKRVEAELELEKLKSQTDGVFSKPENTEFIYIYDSLNIKQKVTLHREAHDDEGRSQTFEWKFNLDSLSVIALVGDIMDSEYKARFLTKAIIQAAIKQKPILGEFYSTRIKTFLDIKDALLSYGFLERVTYSKWLDDITPGSDHKFELTKKYFRFRYWLAYNNKLPKEIIVEIDNRPLA